MRRIRINLLIASMIAILLATPLPSHAAGTPTIVYQKTWGGLANDYANGVAIDASNNTYVVGNTASYGPNTPSLQHAVILKYNSTGGLVWQKLWNGTATDWLQAVAVDRTTGNIVAVGFSSSFGGMAAVILKFNPSGTLLWQHTWQDSSDQGAQGVAIDTSGNIYVAGTDGGGGVGTKVFVLKLSSSGSLLWQKTWGGTKDDEAAAIAVDSYGDSYVTGSTTSYGAGGSCGGGRTCTNIFLLELDFNGNLLSQRTWGGTNPDYGHGIALDSSGNAYIAGSTSNAGAGGTDLVLLKFSGGTLKFQETWGGSKSDVGLGVSVGPSDNVYVSGQTASFGAGGTNVCLLKFNSTGTLLSQVTWGGAKTETGNSIAVNAAGDPLVAGSATEAPPFSLFTNGNSTLGTPTFTPSTSGATLGMPTATLGTPTGTVTDPMGTQTYAGQQDFFLLKTTTPPPTPPATASPLDLTLIGIIVAIVAAAVVIVTIGFLTTSRRKRDLKSTLEKPSPGPS